MIDPGITPGQLKAMLQLNQAVLKGGWRKVPPGLSQFQTRRRKRIGSVLNMYLVRDRTLQEVGRVLGVRHQRVSAILKVGVGLLVALGHVRSRGAR